MQFTMKTIAVEYTAPIKPPEKVFDAKTAYAIARPIFDKLDSDREHFVIIALDPSGNLNGYKHLFSGGQCAVGAHVREVLRAALLLDAYAIVAFHNHPTDDTTPSANDIESTVSLLQACKTIGIDLRDHIVMGLDHAQSIRFDERIAS